MDEIVHGVNYLRRPVQQVPALGEGLKSNTITGLKIILSAVNIQKVTDLPQKLFGIIDKISVVGLKHPELAIPVSLYRQYPPGQVVEILYCF